MTPMPLPTLTATQLLNQHLEFNWAAQAQDERIGLCVVLPQAGQLEGQLEGFEEQRLCDWVEQQTVPIIGHLLRPNPNSRAQPPSALAKSVDVLTTTADELAKISAAIRNSPRAAAILCQVLRSTAAMDVLPALTVESLAYATLQGGSEFHRWLDERGAGKVRESVSDAGSLVLIERLGADLYLVLNSTHNRNALSAPLRDALTDALQLALADTSIDQVFLSGNGPCFCSGGDLTEFGTAQDLAAAHEIRSLRLPARYLAVLAKRCRVRVHGACIGAGIEMSAFSANLAASADTVFQLPEVGMGLIPGAGGCVSIPRRIGRQRTAYWAITGERIDATQALAWGLIDALVD